MLLLSHSWADVGKLRYVPQTPFGYKSFSGRYVHGVISCLLSRRAKRFVKVVIRAHKIFIFVYSDKQFSSLRGIIFVAKRINFLLPKN